MTGASNFRDVGRFHSKFGLYNASIHGAGPQPIDDDLLRYRASFLLEEVLEFMEACGLELRYSDEHESYAIVKISDNEIDHAKAFDALIDEAYVAMGTAHLLGYPWQLGWDEVHEANMLKERAKADGSNSTRKSALDVVKPAGWRPPAIGAVLRRFGFKVKEDQA